MPEEFAARMAARVTEPSGAGLAWRWDARLRSRAGIGFDGLGIMNRSRYLDLMRSIGIPITFVYGRESAYTAGGQAALLASTLPDSRTATIPGGHNVHTDSPAALAEIIAAAAHAGPIVALPDAAFAERES
jgi:pimeloyl-ACP methyl ester carboxylesterase